MTFLDGIANPLCRTLGVFLGHQAAVRLGKLSVGLRQRDASTHDAPA